MVFVLCQMSRGVPMIVVSHESALALWRSTAEEPRGIDVHACDEIFSPVLGAGQRIDRRAGGARATCGFWQRHQREPDPQYQLSPRAWPGKQASLTAGACRCALGELHHLRHAIEVDGITHVLCPSRSGRTDVPDIKAHLCTRKLSGRDLYVLTDGVLVCSPELTLLHLARGATQAKVALLATELCGLYSLDETTRDTGAGFKGRKAPLTQPRLIAHMLDRHPGAPGSPLLRCVLPFVAPYAASPMEAKITLLLCLPRRWGGYGLPLASLNASIRLSPQGEVLMGLPAIAGDLSWPQSHVSIEYDSTAAHGISMRGTWMTHDDVKRTMREVERRRKRDETRLSALSASGWQVYPLVDTTVHDREALDAVARAVARKLRRRLKRDTAESLAHQMRLRKELGFERS